LARLRLAFHRNNLRRSLKSSGKPARKGRAFPHICGQSPKIKIA
jgi:hypothetical protein